MAKQPPKELIHARELLDQGKLDETLEIIENFEKKESLDAGERLSALLIKGSVYLYKQRTRKAVNIYNIAYQMSQDLGSTVESISALTGKAYLAFLGDTDIASTYILDAETKLNSLADDPSLRLYRRGISFIKSWILYFMGKYDEAVKLAEECVNLIEKEKLGNKLDLAATYLLLGWVNNIKGNLTKALKYAMKSMELNKNLNHNVVIPDVCFLIAMIHYSKGNNDQAIEYCKQGLSIKEISSLTQVRTQMYLSEIYIAKGELNLAINYQLQAAELAEKSNLKDILVSSLRQVGYTYRFMGEDSLAIEYCERSLKLAEKWDFKIRIGQALVFLVFLYIDADSREKAIQYYSRISELYEQRKEIGDAHLHVDYLMSKAYVLKTSTRMRDHVEAQTVFKELFDFIIVDQPNNVDIPIWSMGNLCNLLFEELFMYNDPQILDEIEPLIDKSLKIVETRNHYSWLTNVKLLQAKLALIKMDIEEAKRILVEAQHVAESHGLNLLAWGISSEHDKLLDQIDIWEKIKKGETSMADRIELASVDGVLNRLKRKRTVDPPKAKDEESILLLIMDNSGIPYFNHNFESNWDIDGIFSSFMSAFNDFSSELFSKSIDRIRIGENTILIHPIDPFLACYVIKGQSYPALQKLVRFSDTIRENSEIWQALNKSVKTSEVLELERSPALKSVINEIFS
ncbi:MAG: tetratricopeptide repeat protein [Promethearchaeota archaeon]|jgi:tetratricopeptide (TPR) repeat protein